MLSPYTVIELSSISTCLCGQILAQLGARVVAVEPYGGSWARRVGPFLDPSKRDIESSLYWWGYNRGKKSVTLDLEEEEGRAALARLLARADFLIEGFSPGYLASLGLSWEKLRNVNPRLVMVSITPFGQSGPKAKYADSDLIILAASGVLALTGDADRPPVKAPVPQSYLHASAEGAVAALIAHHERVRSGLGQAVDVSAQAATMMATQALVLGGHWGDDLFARAAGGIRVGPIHLRFVYRCLDGHVSITLLFGESVGPATKRLMQWMREERFVDENTVEKNWIDYVQLLRSGEEPITELFRIMDRVAAFCQAHTKRELTEGARRRQILLAPVATVAELLESPQLAARDYWVDVFHPGLTRSIKYPGAFAKLSRTPLKMDGRAPFLGEHNQEILRERSGAEAEKSDSRAHFDGASGAST